MCQRIYQVICLMIWLRILLISEVFSLVCEKNSAASQREVALFLLELSVFLGKTLRGPIFAKKIIHQVARL